MSFKSSISVEIGMINVIVQFESSLKDLCQSFASSIFHLDNLSSSDGESVGLVVSVSDSGLRGCGV